MLHVNGNIFTNLFFILYQPDEFLPCLNVELIDWLIDYYLPLLTYIIYLTV